MSHKQLRNSRVAREHRSGHRRHEAKSCIRRVIRPCLEDLELRQYLAAGVLDYSFHGVGSVVLDSGDADRFYAVAIQADGKIVAAGDSGSHAVVARFNSDGTPDLSFDDDTLNPDGRVNLTLGTVTTARAVRVSPDGKILVVGTAYNGLANLEDFAVARLSDTGALDLTFNTTGFALVDIAGGASDTASALEVDGSGAILVGGRTGATDSDFALIRLDSNGALDTSFDTDGKVVAVAAGAQKINALAIHGTKIVAAGLSGSDTAVLRYNSDGSLDNAFATNGISLTNVGDAGVSDYAVSVIVQGAKYLIGGTSGNDFYATRREADGSVDSAFGDAGVRLIDFGGTDTAAAMALAPNGAIILVGDSVGSAQHVAAARLLADGAMDSDFNGTGKVTHDIAGADTGDAVAVQTDGKIVIAGSAAPASTGDLMLARLQGSAASTIWVNDDWTVTTDVGPVGLSAGDTVSDGALVTGKIFGLDAYATLQDAIDAVAAGGTVHVLAGTYSQSLVISKSVAIKGPNAGTRGYSARVAEATLMPSSGDSDLRTITLSGPGLVVELDGLRFIQGYALHAHDASGADITFHHCLVENALGLRITAAAGIGDLVAENNLFRNISNSQMAPSAVDARSGDLLRFVGNIIIGAQVSGVLARDVDTVWLELNEYQNCYVAAVDLAGAIDTVTILNSFIDNSAINPYLDPDAIVVDPTHLTGTMTIQGVEINTANDALVIAAGANIAGKDIRLIGNILGMGIDGLAIRHLGQGTLNLLAHSTDQATANKIGATYVHSGNSTYLPADGFALEDAIQHHMDDPALGRVIFDADEAWVTAQSGSIERGIASAAAGGTVHVQAGNYVTPAQLVIDKNLSIVGQDKATTQVGIAFDTGVSGDARGWFLVQSGVTFNLSGVTLDGSGHMVFQAIRSRGGGTIDNVGFDHIQYEPAGPTYGGTAVAAMGGAGTHTIVRNSVFTQIGRIGVIFFGAGTSGTFELNTYTGKGAGDWLDYGVEVGGGASAVISRNAISNNLGVASVDGSESAAIIVSTYFGAGSQAAISENFLNNNTAAVFVGYDENDTSAVTVNNNSLSGNTIGVSSTAPAVNAEGNWWGVTSLPAVQALVEGPVDALPILGESTDTAPATPGFQGVAPDSTPPAFVSVPDLFAADDSGVSSTDDLTNLTNPRIAGTTEPGALVEILDGAAVIGSGAADAGGNYLITPTVALSEGAHTLTARATDGSGNSVSSSGALAILIDATGAIAGTLELDPASDTADSGGTSGDGITRDTTPTFNGTAEAGTTITLYRLDGTTEIVLGATTVSGAPGQPGSSGVAWSLTLDFAHRLPTPGITNNYTIYARSTDAAGNSSTISIPLVVLKPISNGAGQEFNTIAEAIAGTSAGGTITIPAGAYSEAITIDKALTLVSVDGAASVSSITLAAGAAVDGAGIASPQVHVQNNASIQDAADLTETGGTLHVQTGVYAQSVTFSRAVMLVSSGAGATVTSITLSAGGDILAGSALVSAPAIQVNGASIADAIALAASGAAVSVGAGTYTENLVIDRPLTLTGAGASVVTIRPATSSPDPGPADPLAAGASTIILVRSSGVTISGMTLDGDNPALISGVVRNGADVDARNGIITDHTLAVVYNNVSVHDVTVRNVYLRGISATTGGTFSISDNTVQNVKGSPDAIGISAFAGTGLIEGNTLSDVHQGIATHASAGTQILDNTITLATTGIHSDDSVGADLIRGNTVAVAAEVSGTHGIYVLRPQAAATVRQNVVGGMSVGLAAIAGGQVVFVGNIVNLSGQAGAIGALVSNAALGAAPANIRADLTGDNQFVGCAAAVLVEQTPGFTASARIVGNDFSNGNVIAIDVSAGAALIEANDLRNNLIGLRVRNGGTVDAGQYAGGTDFTGLGVSAGGNDFRGYAPASPTAGAIVNLSIDATNGPSGVPIDVIAYQNVFTSMTPAAIESVIHHDIDDSSLGYVDFVAFGDLSINAPTTANEGQSITLSGSFVNDPQPHTILIDWGDGTSTTLNLPLGVFTFESNHPYLDNATRTLNVTVSEDAAPGHTLGSTHVIVVGNVAPALSSSGAAAAVEGAPYTLTLGWADPGADTITSWEINWGDGVIETVTTDQDTVYPLNVAHAFADGPAVCSITVTAVDEDGTYAVAAPVEVTVNNVLPTLSATGAANVPEGAPYALTLNRADAGADTITAWEINWGDGTAQTLSTNAETVYPLVVTHVYADGDTVGSGGTTVRAISATAIDDDGTHSVAAPTITVDDVAPTFSLTGAAATDEGTVYSLSLGSISDPGQDTVTAYIIDWGDGSDPQVFDGSPVGQSHTHVYRDGPLTTSIRLHLVNEDDLHSDAGVLPVSVTNVAPIASFAGSVAVNEGTAGFVIFSGQSEVSLDDAAAGLRYAYDFDGDGVFGESGELGDGTYSGSIGAASAIVAASFLAAGPASRIIRARIIDKDGSFTERAWTINVNNVAPTIAPLSDVSVDADAPFTRTGTFSDPGADTWTGTVDYGDGADVEPLSINSGSKTFTLNHTYASAGTRTVTITLSDGTATATRTFVVNVQPGTLRVVSMTPGASGFSATFNRAVDPAKLNMYSVAAPLPLPGHAAFGTADVTLLLNGQSVRGSLHWDASFKTATFVHTGGPLSDGEYTLTLRSDATDGWADLSGAALDGDGNGIAGGDYAASFTISNSASRVLSLPDFARGPGQALDVNLDGTATSTLLPIRLSNGADVTAVSFALHYDPTLLTLSLDLGSAGLPDGWTALDNGSTPGVLRLSVYGTSPLATGAATLIKLTGSIPTTAPYGSAQVLRLSDVEINESLPAIGDSAVHLAAFFGDASGNGRISGVDASAISRIVVHMSDGLSKYPLIDPVIVADVTGNGTLSALDSSLVAQEAALLPVAQIPDFDPLDILVPGPDPIVQIGNGAGPAIIGTRGDTVHVPVAITDNAEGLIATDFVITYDTALLNLSNSDVKLSPYLLGQGWLIVPNVNDAAGTIVLTAYATEALPLGTPQLLDLAFAVPTDALAGTSNVAFTHHPYELNEGGLTMTAVNGTVRIPLATTITGAPVSRPEAAGISLGSTVFGANGEVTFAWNVLASNGQVIPAGNSQTFDFTPTDDGTYTVTLETTDAAGNTGTATATIEVTDVAPTLTISGAPTVAEGGTYTLNLSATDPGTDTIASWTINWGDGSDPQILPGNATSVTHVFADGLATRSVTATAANEDGTFNSNSLEISVTDVAPMLTISGAPAVAEGGTYTLNLVATDPGTDTITSWTINWGDGTEPQVIAGNPSSVTHVFVDDAATRTITATATNEDGTFNSNTLDVSVTDVAPALTISGSATGAEGATYTLTLAATDPGADTITSWTINWGDGTEPQVLAGNPTSVTHVFADGALNRIIDATATNEDGTFNSNTLAVDIADVAPILNITGLAAVDESATYTLNLSVNDPGIDTITSWTILWGDGSDPQVIAGNPTSVTHVFADGAAARSISATATNEDGTFNSNTLDISVTDVAPTLTISGAASVAEGSTYTLSLSAIDPGVDTITSWTINWGDGTDPLVIAGNPTSVTHAFADGAATRSITATATNEDGTFNSNTLEINVTDVAPMLTISGAASIAEGSTYTLNLAATDPGTDTIATWIINWGDGSDPQVLPGNPTSVTHVFADGAATRSITATATNEDGTFNSNTLEISITDVAPAPTISGVPAGNTSPEASPLSLTALANDPGDDAHAFAWSATKDGEPFAFPAGTITNAATLSFTPANFGQYVFTVTVTDAENSAMGAASVTIDVTFVTNRIVNFSPTASGFDATFIRAQSLGVLNLYAGQANPAAPADVTLTGPGGAVRGSIAWNAASNTLSFVATGGVLAAGEYTAVFASRTDGFKDARSGELLDGNSDGTAGDDHVVTFTLAAPGRIVSLGDFARGPGQQVSVPNTSTGLPIRISNGDGVTRLEMNLAYDPALLTINGASLGSTVPGDWSINTAGSTPGELVLVASGVTALPSGAISAIMLDAAVPVGADARYGDLHALQLSKLELNDGAIAATADQAIHQVLHIGDVTGSKAYTGDDAALIARYVVGYERGFDVQLRTDPIILGDTSGNGTLSGLDASHVARKTVGLSVPEMPDIPAGPLNGSGPAPIGPAAVVGLSIPMGQLAPRSSTISLPINITDSAGVIAADFTITYDTARFDVGPNDVQLGSLPSGWLIQKNVDEASGAIRVTIYNSQSLIGGAGSLINVSFHVLRSAAVGSSPVRLLSLAAPGTQVNEGRIGSVLFDGSLVVPRNGDLDLDGDVDADDYFRIDSGFLVGSPSSDPTLAWSMGDMNLDGRIDIDDYFIIDVAYATASQAPAGSAPLAASAPSPVIDLFGDVLEDHKRDVLDFD